MKIRELQKSDLKVLTSKYIEHYNSEGGTWTEDTAYKRLYQLLETPYSYGFVMYEDDLVGFAIGKFSYFDDTVVFFLEEILVFHEYQRHGYGSLLMLELESEVQAQGAKKINLLTTESEQHQSFYEKLSYTKSDFLVTMRKDI